MPHYCAFFQCILIFKVSISRLYFIPRAWFSFWRTLDIWFTQYTIYTTYTNEFENFILKKFSKKTINYSSEVIGKIVLRIRFFIHILADFMLPGYGYFGWFYVTWIWIFWLILCYPDMDDNILADFMLPGYGYFGWFYVTRIWMTIF